MPTKAAALLSLISEAKGIGGKCKLLGAVAGGDLRREHYRRHPKLVQVPFKQFDLCFQIAQGELTPYLELRDIIPRIAPAEDELSKWTVLDCGANIGMFSLFLRKAKRLIAVEPNPECAARIRRNFECNGVRGEVIEAAISETVGSVRMTFDPQASILSKISDEGTTEVPSLTLDSIIEQRGISQVDLLKLDLEGHEMPAFRGVKASLEKGVIRRVFTECYGDEKRAEIDRFLGQYGLKCEFVHDYNVMYVLSGK